MSEIIHAYRVEISKRSDRDVALLLGNLDDNGLRAADLFRRFLSERQEWSSDDRKNHVHVDAVLDENSAAGQFVEAQLRVGENGLRLDIHDSNAHGEVNKKPVFVQEPAHVAFALAQLVSWHKNC